MKVQKSLVVSISLRDGSVKVKEDNKGIAIYREPTISLPSEVLSESVVVKELSDDSQSSSSDDEEEVKIDTTPKKPEITKKTSS